MISFFSNQQESKIFAVKSTQSLTPIDVSKMEWSFSGAQLIKDPQISGTYIGPRATMITPWSTNAVEIMQNMGIRGIKRIECFEKFDETINFDPMLSSKFEGLHQLIFDIDITPDPVREIDDIARYNNSEGLALSGEEISYLTDLSKKLGRLLTDSEVFGFSQVNSEHCRHKIFNGTFIIDDEEMPDSLFALIKQTSKVNPNHIVSAYKDNVAFVNGPEINQLAPTKPDEPSLYRLQEWKSVLSLKAETHNFPTTVEPFNGAATGSGGEIRDRLAGGVGSIPLAGTAVYMTSYPRLDGGRNWEKNIAPRNWLYQSPLEILIKASNGASDFGNKFGQPLICGSLLTFEHQEDDQTTGYDKVIMLAGGVGYGKADQAQKGLPEKGDAIVVMGGDNYRIGMGGAAVSSADTGEFAKGIELNAVQRSNPEMQKRVANAIVALVESDYNPIVSIHDHGAGGHLNCLSELVEPEGGIIHIDQLPIGDPTLSDKEIIGNESQERMGLVIHTKDIPLLKRIADRERAPIYVVGEVTGDGQFTFESQKRNSQPIQVALEDIFGKSPKLIMSDKTEVTEYNSPNLSEDSLYRYVQDVLQLESVACKDWLTNKVDRCVGGKVALQQCCGPLQLPLNNCAIMALDYENTNGVVTSIGHAPIASLIDAEAGARQAIVEAITNIIWAPLSDDIRSISLSANWMWPCKNPGEDARLYQAVNAASEFAIALGINIPTGKDSLSMSQKYKDQTVIAPGTVIISSVAHTDNFTLTVTPDLKPISESKIYFIPLGDDSFALGGSALFQVENKIGDTLPDSAEPEYIKNVFTVVQKAIRAELIYAGHDISSGGMITTLLEMCFPQLKHGLDIDLSSMEDVDLLPVLFSEQAGLIIQASPLLENHFNENEIGYVLLGQISQSPVLNITKDDKNYTFAIPEYRDIWYKTSYLLDDKQTANGLALERYKNYKNQPLDYSFPNNFIGQLPEIMIKSRPQAAIVREKGSNSEREMANAMFQSGFDVLDVHMTDLIEGRIDFSGIRFLGAVGGFSNSDVLGSAKGWAGAFKYNEKANKALNDFFNREDTLSIGICNGCQLFMELDMIYPELGRGARMTYNESHKHESIFTSVDIQKNHSIMMQNMDGLNLGVWVSHGEGKFSFPSEKSDYHIVGTYGYESYPANPNGSEYNAAMVASHDGRHLVTMPHIERSFYAWNWPYYNGDSNNPSKDKVSPWSIAFQNAFKWITQ
jgi:phosphoribosylformylglycinamidine synthase